jgi:hypothetical protein
MGGDGRRWERWEEITRDGRRWEEMGGGGRRYQEMGGGGRRGGAVEVGRIKDGVNSSQVKAHVVDVVELESVLDVERGDHLLP